MKKTYLVAGVIVLVIVLALAYKGRHRIKTMLMGPSTSVTPTTEMASSTPTVSPSPAAAMGGVTMTKTSAKGNYLTDAQGMTLYTFDKDKAGVSNCSGSCAQIWPAFTTTTGTTSSLPANVATMKRADGSMQYTWKGMPLYYYSGDKKAGDMNGNGVAGAWHFVKQ